MKVPLTSVGGWYLC